MIRWPEGLGTDAFLRDHWQKAPLLLAGAIPDLDRLPSPEELAGLACEAEVESRIISGDEQSGWALRHGPFEEDEFLRLPETGWTLLVQDVEKHLPHLGRLLAEFSFLPGWRLDDLMISFAAPGGSVGPHVDAYDVFLIQAAGTRTWELDPEPGDLTCRDDSDVRVLRHFRPSIRHQLTPGDVLYLPPGVAHFGHSTEQSVTCSVGFRAPGVSDLLALASRMCEESGNPMYVDPDLEPGEVEGSRISSAALRRFGRLLASASRATDERLEELLGRLVTEGKPWLLPDRPESVPGLDQIRQRLAADGRLTRDPASRFAWAAGDARCWLFADGAAWALPAAAARFCSLLADGRRLDHKLLEGADNGLAVVRDLLANGSLSWIDGTDEAV